MNQFSQAFSSIASATSRWTGRASAFLICCLVVVAWAASGPAFHYSDTWQLVINTGTTIVTFLMVFLIQNTQNRDNAAVQAKLDELIRASKAKNEFIGIEHLSDAELDAILEQCERHRPSALRRYEARADVHRARAQRLAAIRDVPSQTRDGTQIHLQANIEMLEEIPIAVDLGAEAVGLFRTEFLYLERAELPSEEEQYAHAVAALKSVGGRSITFRTLDLGGDKLPPSVRIPSGTNPAMGLRSIRFSLRREDVFRTQLRALYRAAAVGPMQILFPLISGVAELRAAKRLCEEVREELSREGIPHATHVPLGVMVETPSAATIPDLLAMECDYLSIGTNDLIQYSLAADREDEHVGYLYHPLHPAILRALRQIVVGAERAGKPVAICGDMGGDPALAWVLIGLGLRNLSMAPRQIPLVKSIVRSTRIADAERLAAQALALSTEIEIEELVYGAMNKHFPVELNDGDEGQAVG